MFIICFKSISAVGDTLEEAIENFEEVLCGDFDPEERCVYEAKEIKVQRKFEVIKED